MRDCRLQLWGALWALCGSASTSSLHSESWLPLFKHAISILDKSGKRRSDMASSASMARQTAVLNQMAGASGAVGLYNDNRNVDLRLQPPFVLATQRHLVTAIVGLLGHAFDDTCVREHVRDLNGSDDVLSRLLTAADPEVDDKIIALTRMALGKLVDTETLPL